jgi:hypothetical protein
MKMHDTRENWKFNESIKPYAANSRCIFVYETHLIIFTWNENFHVKFRTRDSK